MNTLKNLFRKTSDFLKKTFGPKQYVILCRHPENGLGLIAHRKQGRGKSTAEIWLPLKEAEIMCFVLWVKGIKITIR